MQELEQKLELELKQFVIATLQLEDMTPTDIPSDQILFGEGLGLDSVDALELGVALQKRYKIKIAANSEETRHHFACIRNLARFIASQSGAQEVA